MTQSGRQGGVIYRLPLFVLLLGLVTIGTAQSREDLLRLRPARGDTPTAGTPAPRRDFPHLLTAYGPRSDPSFAPTPLDAALRRTPRPGGAEWDPASGLPPSCLSPERLARAAALRKSQNLDEIRRLVAEAKAEGEPDTVRILVLRVDFERDTPGSRTSGDGRFDLRRDEEARAIPIDPPPHDRSYFDSHLQALARYYDVMSGGALVLQWDIFPAGQDSAYHLPDTRKYGPWIFSNSNPDVLLHAIELVGDALATADSTDASLDFTRERDGSVEARYDSYLLFHAGADYQGDIYGDSPFDIPSFNLFVVDPFMVQDSTVAIDLVQVVPESATQDGFYGALNGVVTHEFGHQLTFEDLYDVKNGLPVVGAFSLMDSGENLYGTIVDPADTTQILPVRGVLPASLDPWHKFWVFPDGIDLVFPESYLSGDQRRFETELEAIELSNRILYVPINLWEYLLVENRKWELNGDSLIVLKQDKETGVILGPVPADTLAPADDAGYREYDYLLPAEGLVVWHVDEAAAYAGRMSPYGGVNIFWSRPGVAVVEADGIRDIGTASNEFTGGPYDTWYLGGYSCLTPTSTPSSATNDGTPTGITLCALDSIAISMRVSVENTDSPPGWPIAFVGSPADGQLLPIDLDGDGARELLSAGDVAIFGFRADGLPIREETDPIFVSFPLPIEGALAGTESFRFPGETEAQARPLVAATAGGTLWMMDGTGNVAASWPSDDPGLLGDSVVTAGPVVLDSLVWVGSHDGTVRAIRPGGGRPAAVRVPTGGAAVRALGVGRLRQEGFEGDLTIFSLSERGERNAWRWSGSEAEAPVRIFGPLGGGPAAEVGTAAAVLAAPIGPGGAPRYLYSIGSRGELLWCEADGSPIAGWPATLGGALAGDPILAEADGDGALETVALTKAGRLHVLGENGVDELHFPRRIWSEDDTSPPEQTSGPRAIDVDADGTPEILIHRGDGFLLALEADGRSTEGWPRAFGSLGLVGPEYVPAGGGYTARFVVGNAYSRTAEGRLITAVSVLRTEATGDAVGSFAVPGVDRGRTRCYPAERVPVPAGPAAERFPESVRLYPNPLREDAVTFRCVLDRPAQLELKAFDLAGAAVAELAAPGVAGPSGNHLRWDLSGLAPGLYHIRVRAVAGESREELFTKLAVVR